MKRFTVAVWARVSISTDAFEVVAENEQAAREQALALVRSKPEAVEWRIADIDPAEDVENLDDVSIMDEDDIIPEEETAS